jgi:hypothetical protein
MKKLFSILLLAIVISSCENYTTGTATYVKEGLYYFKDEKTGLCFAALTSTTYSNFRVTSITAVDCDKVKNFIK